MVRHLRKTGITSLDNHSALSLCSLWIYIYIQYIAQGSLTATVILAWAMDYSGPTVIHAILTVVMHTPVNQNQFFSPYFILKSLE